MSAKEIAAAQACGELECPVADGGPGGVPGNCSIPNGGTPDQYCLSVTFGMVTQALLATAVVFYMVGVGAAMDMKNIRHARQHPRAPIVGLLCQVVLNPVLMFALIALFGSAFPISTRIMAILIASAPGGNGSNLLALLGYGSVELSVVMTVFSTFCAFATMPFYIWLGTNVIWAQESSELSVDFVAIALSAVLATALPLLGLLLKLKAGDKWAKPAANVGSVVGVGGTVFVAFLYLADPLFRAGLRGLGPAVWACGFFLNVGGLIMGYSASRLMGFPRRFHRTIAFEVGSQNVSIPLAIVSITFSAGPVASLFTPFLGAYIIGSLPTNYGAMLYWRYCDPIREPHHDGFDEDTEDTGDTGDTENAAGETNAASAPREAAKSSADAASDGGCSGSPRLLPDDKHDVSRADALL